MSESRIVEEQGQVVLSLPDGVLLDRVARLIRSTMIGESGADDVLRDLCRTAAEAIGVDEVRVLRADEDSPLVREGRDAIRVQPWLPARDRSPEAGLGSTTRIPLQAKGCTLGVLEHALMAEARQRSGVAVMFIDIDGVKDINDRLGHQVGDVVLVTIARRLAGAVRVGDTVGRLGGDEFLVICENLVGPRTLVARRLNALGRRLQRRMRFLTAGEVTVSASVGISVATHPCTARAVRSSGGTPSCVGISVATHPCTALELVEEADRARYRAKRRGGGRLVIARPTVLPFAAQQRDADGGFLLSRPERSAGADIPASRAPPRSRPVRPRRRPGRDDRSTRTPVGEG